MIGESKDVSTIGIALTTEAQTKRRGESDAGNPSAYN